MKFAISPIHTTDDFPAGFSLEGKIDVFSARIEGWQLGIALALEEKQIPHRGFAILHILLSLFEMIGKYREGYLGNSKSKYYFKLGAQFVFQKDLGPEQETFLEALYKNVRSGIYHIGMTSPQVLLVDEIPGSIGFQSGTRAIAISPDKLAIDLTVRFRDYIGELRNPQNVELRLNFEKRFDYDNRKTELFSFPTQANE
jgi:hypothetical protein